MSFSRENVNHLQKKSDNSSLARLYHQALLNQSSFQRTQSYDGIPVVSLLHPSSSSSPMAGPFSGQSSRWRMPKWTYKPSTILHVEIIERWSNSTGLQSFASAELQQHRIFRQRTASLIHPGGIISTCLFGLILFHFAQEDQSPSENSTLYRCQTLQSALNSPSASTRSLTHQIREKTFKRKSKATT